MAKVIDETKLNYNKYPGEHVMASGEVVQVGKRTFTLFIIIERLLTRKNWSNVFLMF